MLGVVLSTISWLSHLKGIDLASSFGARQDTFMWNLSYKQTNKRINFKVSISWDNCEKFSISFTKEELIELLKISLAERL